MTQQSPPPPGRGDPVDDPLFDYAKVNPALAIAASIAAIAAGQVIFVARADIPTALAIVEAQDLPSIVLGTVTSFTPLIALLTAFYTWPIAASLYEKKRRTMLLTGLALLATIVAVMAAPMAILIPSAALWIAYRPVTRWWYRRRGLEVRFLPESASGALLTVLVFTIASRSITADAWLPRERITTDTQTLVGYVLGTEGNWTTILNHQPRYITLLQQSDIRRRVICQTSYDWYSVSLMSLARMRSAPPATPCPLQP